MIKSYIMTKSNAEIIDQAYNEGDIQSVESIYELITFKLSLLGTAHDRIGQRFISEHVGLPLREFRTLAIIDYLDPATVAEVARESFLDHAQVSRAISKLVEQGYVSRGRGVSRGGTLALTDKGKSVVRKGLPYATFLNQRINEGISQEDREAFFRVVDTLLDWNHRRFAVVNGNVARLTSINDHEVKMSSE